MRYKITSKTFGHLQANRQLFIKTFNTLCFLGIFSYFTVYHCYRVMLQMVLQNLFPQKKNARHDISKKLPSAQRVEIMFSNISNTTRTVSSNIQTPRSGYTDLSSRASAKISLVGA